MLTYKHTFSAALISVCQAQFLGTSMFSKALLGRRQLKAMNPCEIVKIEMENLCSSDEVLATSALAGTTTKECTEETQELGEQFGCNLNKGTGTLDIDEFEAVFFEDVFVEAADMLRGKLDF